MVSTTRSLLMAFAALALIQAPGVAQGKGAGKGHAGDEARGQGPAKAQGKARAQAKQEGRGRGEKEEYQGRGRPEKARATPATARGAGNARADRAVDKANGKKPQFTRAASISSMPVSVRRFAATGKPKNVIAAAAVAHAFARGHGDDFRIDEVGNRMRIRNRTGDELLELDDRDAEDLGRWRVGVMGDETREGAPSFCRSGAGHPVWGRQWCIDKGFGLGSYDNYRWGRTRDVGGIVLPRTGIGATLATAALANLLGPTAFNRLALHAVTLGLVEPLTGRWVSQPTGPQLLMVNSGSAPVAELVDTNRDYRLDELLVALLPW